MALEIRPVTAENRKELMGLSLARGQEGFIETVEECLEEAAAYACWRPVGLYDGETPVGFAMYCRWEGPGEQGRVWMDRLLIDGGCQGKGYGRQALTLLLARMEREYGAHPVYLSVYRENQRAVRLYESFGFRFTGELDLKGELMMVRETNRTE